MAAPRLRVGTHPASDMTSTYDVSAFTVQADQRNYPWALVVPTELAREFDGQSEGMDGTRRMIGKWNGSLHFTAVTPLMFQYIQQNLFPTDGVNEDLTVVIYSVKYGWVCIQASCHLNELALFGQSRRHASFVEGVQLIDFNEGVLSTGGGFSSGFSSGFDIGGIPT